MSISKTWMSGKENPYGSSTYCDFQRHRHMFPKTSKPSSSQRRHFVKENILESGSLLKGADENDFFAIGTQPTRSCNRLWSWTPSKDFPSLSRFGSRILVGVQGPQIMSLISLRPQNTKIGTTKSNIFKIGTAKKAFFEKKVLGSGHKL